jgi:NAD+ synthase
MNSPSALHILDQSRRRRPFTAAVLELDAAAETDRIARAIRVQIRETLRRRGAVVGLSGGIDSSVVAALCVRALGPGRVFGLMMPERDSAGQSLQLAQDLAARLGIDSRVEDIAPALDAAGCYGRLEEAIRTVVPEYSAGWKCKLVLPSLLAGERLNVMRLAVEDPAGCARTLRLTADAYLQIVAATNFKQRIRKMNEYYHADRLHYAVAGTPNRLEYDQGFFVKQGDGAADLKPIAHLYKTQVYQLAAFLGVPEAIRMRPSTTDTYSLDQTQEEFYFALPYCQMDLCLYAYNHQLPAKEAAQVAGLAAEQVERVYRDISAKRRATRYLHAPALLVEPVDEI